MVALIHNDVPEIIGVEFLEIVSNALDRSADNIGFCVMGFVHISPGGNFWPYFAELLVCLSDEFFGMG